MTDTGARARFWTPRRAWALGLVLYAYAVLLTLVYVESLVLDSPGMLGDLFPGIAGGLGAGIGAALGRAHKDDGLSDRAAASVGFVAATALGTFAAAFNDVAWGRSFLAGIAVGLAFMVIAALSLAALKRLRGRSEGERGSG